jgi:hypothetical protein
MSLKPMRSKLVLTLVTFALLLSGCSNDASLTSGEENKSYNSLSGREGSDGPILAVKIDDTSLARPQIGLEEADVVYIEQVEGGLTRLAAIFSSSIPQRIGPIRSARISDIDILAQYGKVVFAFSGAQRAMLTTISNSNLWDYGAQRSSPVIYTRDETRRSPYDMVLRSDLLLEKVNNDGRDVAVSKSVGWSFGQAPQGGVAIDSVSLRWPASKYEASWSKAEQRWLLSNGGVANFAISGKQLGPTTFVIQNVEMSDSIFRGSDGSYTPLSETVGSGTGYILRDGRSFKANWSRPMAESGTSWTLADGSEIKFAPGSIWVALTDRKPAFTLSAPTPMVSK